MDRPLSAVVRVASTPDQAKVFAALLQAEGIPAYIEGDMLADEVAASRRLINLAGTRVLVPSASLERAREILDNAAVDPAELEQQALAAAEPEHMPEEKQPAPPVATRTLRWALVVAIAAAVVFFGLWLAEVDARAAAQHPRFVYEWTEPSVMQELRRSDRLLIRSMYDRNMNSMFERITLHRPDGSVCCVMTDADEDGLIESCEERREDGTTATMLDVDANGTYDEIRVTDREARVLQTLVWQPGMGFVPKKP